LNVKLAKWRLQNKIVNAAAGNANFGVQMTRLLLGWRGDEVKITEEVLQAAAGNKIRE
jgi:hypothetical protein